MKFTCEKCGNVTKVGGGRISLLCQSCGCLDLKFDVPIIVHPVLKDGEIGVGVVFKANEPLFGSHKDGQFWIVKEIISKPPQSEDKFPTPSIQKEAIKETVEIKDPKPPVEETKEEEPPIEKPRLLKVRKAKVGISGR